MRHTALLLAAALPFAALAQEETPAPSGRVWTATVPGGSYTVAVSAILAVSKHEYIVDGTQRVTEVNVDTAGALAVRFYHIEPSLPKSPVGQSLADKAIHLAGEAASRTGKDAGVKSVLKNYPATTHARTIEFRVASLEDLDRLLRSAERALVTGRGGRIEIE